MGGTKVGFTTIKLAMHNKYCAARVHESTTESFAALSIDFLFFFCLETKETKIQGGKNAYTQARGHRLPPVLHAFPTIVSVQKETNAVRIMSVKNVNLKASVFLAMS